MLKTLETITYFVLLLFVLYIGGHFIVASPKLLKIKTQQGEMN